MSIHDLIAQAKAALESGNIAEAKALQTKVESALEAAKITKSLSAAEAALKANDDNAVKSQRLPFGNPDSTGSDDAVENIAVKTWYAKRNGGDPDSELDMIMTDLYGSNYRSTTYAKTADFGRFLRTGQADPRLMKMLVHTPSQIKAMVGDGMSVAEIKNVQTESQDTLGGYLVPEDFRDRVIARVMGMTVMRKITDPISTMRDRVVVPVITGGDSRFTSTIRATWVDESPTSTQAATNAEFGQVSIPIHTLMSHLAISKNALEDTMGATSIALLVEQRFAEAFALTEDEAFLVGNGVGKPLGILRDATTGGPNALGYGTPVIVTSGAATKLTADSIRNTPYNLDSQYRALGGNWVMSKSTVRTIGNLKDGNGNYLWADRNQQLQTGRPPRLEGFEILESEVLASPTSGSGDTYTANVYPILFLCRGAYSIVDRIGMSVERYDDSTTAKQNQIVLVARHRVGGQVVDPWKIATLKIAAS